MKKKRLVYLIIALFLIIALIEGMSQSSQESPFIPEHSDKAVTHSSTETVPDNAASDAYPFEVHFIDVGQADAVLVISDDKSMLVDAGESSDSQAVYTYLEKHNIYELEYIVMTHAHSDHIGGIPAAFEHSKVKKVLAPFADDDSKLFEKIKARMEDQELSVAVPVPGDVFLLGDASIEIVGPINESSDKNNMSLVIRIQYGDISFLLTGDAEKSELNEIINAGYFIGCDVMKIGHHGSSVSLTDEILEKASPSFAVISVGKDNKYGHPTDEALDFLKNHNIPVYRTDESGDIVFLSDGNTVTVTTARNSTGTQKTEETVKYVVNTGSKKFHTQDCCKTQDISQENRLESNEARDALISGGYTPCGICNP